jgi:hypothetical protein
VCTALIQEVFMGRRGELSDEELFIIKKQITVGEAWRSF